MVETLRPGGEHAETIKASVSLPRVDGLTQRLALQEIRFLEVDGTGQPQAYRSAGSTNLLGQPHLEQVAGLPSFHYTQSALSHEAAHGTARSRAAQASAVGDPGNRKAEAEPPFQAAVPQEMTIDGAVDHGKAQPRHELVFQVFPELFGVRFFLFHVPIQRINWLKPTIWDNQDKGKMKLTVDSSQAKEETTA